VPSSGPWLGIDYGTAETKAVLVFPHGSTLLIFDGSPTLSNAVHIGSGDVVAGAAAWQQAAGDPDGFVPSPLAVGDAPLHVGGVDWDPADLVAATLRLVMAQANTVAGQPIEDIRMVVPAGWGPRRRTWWRRAASKAGLGPIRLVEAPVAVVMHLASVHGVAGPARWLVVDVGAGCEVSVVGFSAGAGFEVLATMRDALVGGDGIDTALVQAVTGSSLEDVPADRRGTVAAAVRAAKHALAGQPAVTVPLPDQPPVVIGTAMLQQAARPVLEQAAALARQVVASLDMTVDQMSAVIAVGASMTVPGAADMLAEKLGVPIHVPERPGFVAVLGAADASLTSPGGAAAKPARTLLPPLHRLIGLGLPGLLSLVLYAHFVFGTDFNNGTPSFPLRYYYVSASWGELTVAAVLALLTCLQAAALIGALLPGRPNLAVGQLRDGSISSGAGVAAAAGVAVASLYAVTAAVYFAKPVRDSLTWAVIPVLPLAFCAVVLAVVAWHRAEPPGGWEAFLAFPLSSMMAATAGMLAVSAWWHGSLRWLGGWADVAGPLGGILMTVAVACTVARHLLLRLTLTVLLGFFGAVLSHPGAGILAVIYALAVAMWWAYRTWVMFRTVPRSDRRRVSTPATG
jgi:hypothetical protein